jgi:hypothetical protein
MEIFHRDQDVLIMGNNKKLYRGRIDSCEIMALKKSEEKKLKIKTNIEEKNDVHFDQFDQSNQRIFDEHLFEYLDWQIQFNEQVFSQRKKQILSFNFHIRIYLMNSVKNYSIIGHRLYVMINPVLVIQNLNHSQLIFHRNHHQRILSTMIDACVVNVHVVARNIPMINRYVFVRNV